MANSLQVLPRKGGTVGVTKDFCTMLRPINAGARFVPDAKAGTVTKLRQALIIVCHFMGGLTFKN
jgi:hypothetical protein